MVQRLLLRRRGGRGKIHGALRRRKIRSETAREGEQLDAVAEVSGYVLYLFFQSEYAISRIMGAK